ncbi:MAG: 3-isopropylmalate dehydratase small subunit [Roseburia sp.]|nr:3-isopropylmalate dehydratase small subunit [Roseburia sp.]
MGNGKCFKFADNIDTDAIIAARYLNISDFDALKAHCMEDIDDVFAKSVRPNDFIVAGENFGCGSSREHAPAVIKACGVRAVIAKSFARIFYRNAINIGLPIIECAQAADDAQNGDELSVDFDTGTVRNITRNKSYSVPPYPDEIKRIIERGGLLA